MFRPKVHIPAFLAGEPMPDGFPAAMAVHYVVDASRTWFDHTTEADQLAACEMIIASRSGALSAVVASARQDREMLGLPGVRVQRDWPDMLVEYAYNSGLEDLRMVVRPERAVGGSKPLQPPGVADVKVPFAGFPVPGLGLGVWPLELQPNGPFYPFDPAFSPSDPGPRSAVDAATGFYFATSPVVTPDVGTITQPAQGLTNEILLTLPLTYSYDDLGVPSVADTSNNYGFFPPIGVASDYWCRNIGGAAILSVPFSGKQYLEFELVKLPQGRVPNDFTVNYAPAQTMARLSPPAGDFSAAWTTGSVTSQLMSFTFVLPTVHWPYDVYWPAKLDAFGTPSIGLVPSYYLPDDMQNDAPGGPVRVFKDFSRVPGMDPLLDPNTGDKTKLARSITMTRMARRKDENGVTPNYFPGVWEIPGYATSYNYTHATDWPAQKIKLQSGDFSGMPTLSAPGQNCFFFLVADNPYQIPNPLKPQPLPGPMTLTLNSVATGPTGYGPFPVFDQGVITVTYAPPNLRVGDTTLTVTQDWPTTMLASSTANQTTDGFNPPLGGAVIPVAGGTDFGWVFGADQVSINVYGHHWIDYAQGVEGYNDHGILVGGADWLGWDADPTDTQLSGSDAGPLYFLYHTNTDGSIVINWTSRYVSGVGLRYTSGFVANYPRTSWSGDFFPSFDDAVTASVNSSWPDAVTKLWDDGHHAPVFVGRIDQWTLFGLNTPDPVGVSNGISDGANVPLDGSLAGYPFADFAQQQLMGSIGQYTGLDLGGVALSALKEGDRVMLSVDTATGYVWFGKNGVWYDKDGAIPPGQGPEIGARWVAVMDGYPKSWSDYGSGKRPKYHPALGWRIGQLEAKIYYGGGFKYAQPSGFKPYPNI